MKGIPIDKLMKAILSDKNLKKMSSFATSTTAYDAHVIRDVGSTQCCSYQDYYTGLIIKLGDKFYQSTFNDTDDVSPLEVRDKYKTVATIMYGAYYHELFHLKWTPFRYAHERTARCPWHFRSFAHSVYNILEDVAIEGNGKYQMPFCIPYLDALTECFKQPGNLDMLTKSLTEEPEHPSTMLAYLLYYCRGVDLSSLPPYKIWEDNKEFIVWSVYKCINTHDPYLRARRCLAFALQLVKILQMEEPSKDSVEDPNRVDLQQEGDGLTEIPSGGIGKKLIDILDHLTDTATDGVRDGKPEDTEGEIESPGELTQLKASRDGSTETSKTECPTSVDLTKEGITMIANDDPVLRCPHIVDSLNNFVNTSRYLPAYNKVVQKNELLIKRVVAVIRKMHATNNASWSHYKMNGKLDLSTIYKKDNYKIFKKKNSPAPTADLVVCIPVDISGSMQGLKASLAGEALIVFCEALNRLHIPFCVSAFTEAHQAVTIMLKDYDESYDKVKTNMTLLTEQYNCDKLATWCGNIDEVNIQYAARELLNRRERDKIMIVISDGATCGSVRDLKKISDDMEAKGITVLGIGIFDDNVKDIYKNHMILKTTQDLEGLGAFLNKYLIGKIFK